MMCRLDNLLIILLSVLVFFCSSDQLLAQNVCKEGLLFTYYKHVPERNDSMVFSFYPNGKAKFLISKFDTEYDFYLDSNDKDSELDYFLLVSNSEYLNERDSSKYQYYYKNGLIDKVVVTERKCFKSNSSGGCIRYDNKHSGYWRIIMEQFYKNDLNGNVTNWITYFDTGKRRDTIIKTYEFVYDDYSKVIRKDIYKNGVLELTEKFGYGKKYEKYEKYPSFNKDSIPWIQEEMYYDEKKLLIRKVVSGKFNNGSKYEYIFSYSSDGFPLKEIKRVHGEKEPLLIKEYRYSRCN